MADGPVIVSDGHGVAAKLVAALKAKAQGKDNAKGKPESGVAGVAEAPAKKATHAVKSDASRPTRLGLGAKPQAQSASQRISSTVSAKVTKQLSKRRRIAQDVEDEEDGEADAIEEESKAEVVARTDKKTLSSAVLIETENRKKRKRSKRKKNEQQAPNAASDAAQTKGQDDIPLEKMSAQQLKAEEAAFATNWDSDEGEEEQAAAEAEAEAGAEAEAEAGAGGTAQQQKKQQQQQKQQTSPHPKKTAGAANEDQAEETKRSKKRPKKRSRQKNLRKDNRPAHMKPGNRASEAVQG